MSDKSNVSISIMEKNKTFFTFTFFTNSLLSDQSLRLPLHTYKIHIWGTEMRSPMSSAAALDILKSNGDTTFSVYGPCHWNRLSVYPSSLTLVLFMLFFHHLYSFNSYMQLPHSRYTVWSWNNHHCQRIHFKIILFLRSLSFDIT